MFPVALSDQCCDLCSGPIISQANGKDDTLAIFQVELKKTLRLARGEGCAQLLVLLLQLFYSVRVSRSILCRTAIYSRRLGQEEALVVFLKIPPPPPLCSLLYENGPLACEPRTYRRFLHLLFCAVRSMRMGPYVLACEPRLGLQKKTTEHTNRQYDTQKM